MSLDCIQSKLKHLNGSNWNWITLNWTDFKIEFNISFMKKQMYSIWQRVFFMISFYISWYIRSNMNRIVLHQLQVPKASFCCNFSFLNLVH